VDASSLHKSRALIRKLESIFDLADEERAALEALPMQVQVLKADQDIVREGDRPSRSCLILDGYAATYKMTGTGKRQIMAFHMPGDIPDLQSLHLKVLDSSLGTLTQSTVGFIQHETLRDLCRRYPRLNDAFWRETLVDASIFREWVMNLGQREATNRIAHLFCEWVVRGRAVGLVRDHTCEMPMTQAELGDAMGISTVHINRVLQALRAQGLIRLAGSTLTVLDWEQLKHVGDFEPTYLHLEAPGQATA
jgi:CRP-like cAMP-binding protein